MRLDVYLENSQTPVEKFAEAIGVHRTSVYRFIKGLAFPRPSTIARITEVTKGKVTANDFIAVLPSKDSRLTAVG
jgi:DNA-binding transcriptional regulator YdaS (Cro superfamily)